ncbi:MAG: dihydroxyacetone kinase subunit DhaK [Rhizobiales bacterium]|nr:dihydroxyacetone kinase subunit DhaK [Hyphomicrobiales bacterium]
MKKFINRADTFLDESLRGFAATHADLVDLDPGLRFVQRKFRSRSKVALVSGGGAGHEPLHIGFVGLGMLDAACPGQVFTSPTPAQIVSAILAVDSGVGSLLVVKNYEGDVMNFDMAMEMGRSSVGKVLVDDDVSIRPSAQSIGRRGVAGTILVEKMLGAAAEQGRGLAALVQLGSRIAARIRSIGVALSPCTVPALGRPTFDLGLGDMEVGVGIHGEAGVRRAPLKAADHIAEEMLDSILAELEFKPGQPSLLLVNGFGGTPSIELYLMAHAARRNLERRGIVVARSTVGSYVSSLDMAGCSLTLAALDDEMIELWDAPVCTAAFRWGV